MAQDKKASKKTGVAAWNESAGIETRSSGSRQNKRNRAVADKRKRKAALVALALLCAVCVGLFWPPKDRIERGLWLKGGMAYTMAADDSSADLSAAVGAIQGRLGSSGLAEYAVSQEGGSSVVIDLQKMDDSERIARMVGGKGSVEFVRMDEIGDADALVKVNAGTEDVQVDKGMYESFLDGSDISSASVEEVSSGTYAVKIAFTDEGAKTFADVTEELAEEYGRIAIMVDSRIVSAPSVSEKIEGGTVYISGDFTRGEADALKAVLDGTPLDTDLTYVGSKEIGPLAGKTVLWGMVGAVVIGFVVVTILAARRFGKLALIVSGSMIVYTILILGLMALASRLSMFVLTVPGVFGGVFGAAVSTMATWLIIERFANRVADGKSIRGAATTAPREGLSPLGMPLAAASVIAIVLLFLPVLAMRDFGETLLFGFICGIAAVCWFSITMLRLLAAGPIQNDPAAWGLAVPDGKDAAKHNKS